MLGRKGMVWQEIMGWLIVIAAVLVIIVVIVKLSGKMDVGILRDIA